MKKEVQFSKNRERHSLTAEIDDAGDVVIDYYNYSDSYMDVMGHDASFVVKIACQNKAALVQAIRSQEGSTSDEDTDWEILHFLAHSFSDDEEIKKWLLNSHIPFKKFSDTGWGLFERHPSWEDTVELAQTAHAGQLDKAGAPYYGHLERVMNSVDDKAKIIALLHDSLEDTFVTAGYLRDTGYSDDLIAAIEALTKRPDEADSDEGYMRFIRRAAQNPLARLVKMADLRDNMDLSRLPKTTPKDHACIEKYQRALEYLEALPVETGGTGPVP